MRIRYSGQLIGMIALWSIGIALSGCRQQYMDAIVEKKPVQYTITVEKDAGGEVTVTPLKKGYKKGEIVILTAKPDGEHRFTEWKGSVNMQENPCTVTVNGSMTILAHFTAIPKYKLTVSAGMGGKIVNNAGEKTEFLEKEKCVLTAEADAGYEFMRWEGDVESENNKLYLTFEKDYQIHARFKEVADIYTVTISKSGNGQIIRSSTKAHYAHNERLTLQAKAEPGWIFKQWNGVSEAQKYEREIEVKVNTHKSISAEFVKRKWTYIMYLSADNELEGAALRAINELEGADWRGQDVSVLALIDRHPGYDATDGNWSGTRLYEIRYDKAGVNSTILSDRLDCAVLGLSKSEENELDMSSAHVLKAILEYAKEQYEAEQYGLIIWGHGAGWRGMLKDETGGGNAMKISRLGSAVKDKGLSIIAFDTGFAGNLEVMYELKDAGVYGIGSSGASPAEGWDYRKLFTTFLASGKSAEDFCTAAVEAYKEKYSGTAGADITVCKLEKMGEIFSAYEVLSKEVSEAVVSRPIAAKVKAIVMSESQTYRNSSYPSDVYTDIKDSAGKLQAHAAELTGDVGKQQRIRDAAAQVIQAVDGASSGWIEGKGEAGHIGIYVHQMQSADAETGVHDAAYVRGSGEAAQCEFVKKSEWWVVQNSKDRSVLDKIFYQYR